MNRRYYLVAVPEDDPTLTDTVLSIIQGSAKGELAKVQVVEVVPEQRDSNWMERAIAAKFAAEQGADA